MNASTNFTILRHNNLCVELKSKNGIQVIVYKKDYYYYDSKRYIYASKNGEDLKSLNMEREAELAITKTGIQYASSSLRYLTGKQNIKYIDEIIADIETAKNPEYIGLYCICLIYEISKLNQKNMEIYIKKIIPFLHFASDFISSSYADLLSIFDKHCSVSQELKTEFYLNLYKADLYVFRSYTRNVSENINLAINYALTTHRKDLKDTLLKYQKISSDNENIRFVLNEYKGIGINPDELLDCLMTYKRSDLLYYYLTDNIDYIKKELGNNGFSVMIYLRYLDLNGYKDKIPSLAKKLIKYIKSTKDYYSLRVFLTDDDILDIYINDKKDDKELVNYTLPICCENEKLSQQIMTCNKLSEYGYYSYKKEINLLSYAYSYLNNLKKLDDYDCKDFRMDIRSEMNYGRLKEKYEFAIGLVGYQDKNATRYFFSPEFDSLLGNPYFAIAKSLAYTKQGKKIKNMYQYPEVK